MAVAVTAEFIDGDDVRMVETRGGFGFLLETEQALGVSRKFGGENFDGDTTIQTRVNGVVDLAHPACA